MSLSFVAVGGCTVSGKKININKLINYDSRVILSSNCDIIIGGEMVTLLASMVNNVLFVFGLSQKTMKTTQYCGDKVFGKER